jgi:hypothetical protein
MVNASGYESEHSGSAATKPRVAYLNAIKQNRAQKSLYVSQLALVNETIFRHFLSEIIHPRCQISVGVCLAIPSATTSQSQIHTEN